MADTGKLTSGVGPTYIYNDSKTAAAATEAKLATLDRKNKDLGAYARKLLNLPANNSSSSSTQPMTSLDSYSRNLLQTLFSQELSNAKTNGGGGDLLEAMKPISTHVGGSIGALNNIQKDHTGPTKLLTSAMSNAVQKIAPGFEATIDSAFKKLKLDNQQHLPDQVHGSSKSLATAGDSKASLPHSLQADIYSGASQLTKAMAQIGDAQKAIIQKLQTGIASQITGLLDGFVPSGISQMIVGQLQGQVSKFSSIAEKTTGVLSTNKLLGQLQNSSGSLTSALQNPLKTAVQYASHPPAGGGHSPKIPTSILNKLVPQVTSILGKSSTASGLGFSGNQGFGLHDALAKNSESIINNIASSVPKSQLGILTSILNVAGGAPDTNKNHPPSLTVDPTNPGLSVTHGVPQPQSPPPPII